MAISYFSEFSYGFALTYELVFLLQRHGIYVIKAPEMPSLRDEGKDKGYDVKINTIKAVFFIQFKLSDYMHGKTATAIKDKSTPDPYYRFFTRGRKSSNQHDDLLKLETKGNEVYYVAPIFHGLSEFDDHFVNTTMCDNSAFISPSKIGSFSDAKDHQVCFDGAKLHKVYSEMREMEGPVRKEDFINSIVESRLNLEEDFFIKLYNDLVSIKEISNEVSIEIIRRYEQNYFAACAYVARHWFSLELFVATSS